MSQSKQNLRTANDLRERETIKPEGIFLDETQLSQRWHVSVRTLQNNRVQGSGVAFLKFGRTVRYRLSDIVEYENNALRASTNAGDVK